MKIDIPSCEMAESGYAFIKELGSGLFGTCYLCINRFGKAVVLKRYEPASYRMNQGKNHYEAGILSTLSHPSIPELFGVLDTSCGKYLILEYILGITLKTALFEKHKVFSDLDISRIGMQLLSVITYLHRRNIVHRDISIDNVIDDGIQITLVDFGLSRAIRYEEMAAQEDYYCFGEVLLFMLYSRHSTPPALGDDVMPWYEELNLDESQKLFISRLLDIEMRFDSIFKITDEFIEFLKKGLPIHL